MAIPDEVQKCVFFVGYRMADGSVHLAGTAFNLARMIEGTDRAWHYIVTARHVIDHIRNFGLNTVLLRITHKSGGAFWVETNVANWLVSPGGPSVDMAILKHLLDLDWDHLNIPVHMAVTDVLTESEKIGVDDEVFMTVFFATFWRTEQYSHREGWQYVCYAR
jgi:hypothetical protein